MPVEHGSVTFNAAAIATAASAALPPRRRTSAPTRDAATCELVTIPLIPRAHFQALAEAWRGRAGALSSLG